MFVDAAPRDREVAGRPIRVGMIGAGATGRAIAFQLGTPAPGIRLVAISNRTIQHGERAYREVGITNWQRAESSRDAGSLISRGTPVLTDDPSVLTRCDGVDIIVEVTGTVTAAARTNLDAFRSGKHVVLVNTELDSFVGPSLKAKADQELSSPTRTEMNLASR